MHELCGIDRDLTLLAERYDLLQHPFYQRWVKGELTREELVYYAGQYAHVVRALPRWLEAAAHHDLESGPALQHHAREESSHVAMWEEFAEALGINASQLDTAAANPATTAFLSAGDELAARGQAAAVVWSIESQSPAVSAEKLRGLRTHYGIDEHNGGRYFAVHQELDRDHESQLRHVISAQDQDRRREAPKTVETTLMRMWDLLTAVESA